MMVATCGSVSALTLGLPSTSAVSAEKGTLPQTMFYSKAAVSAKLKQHFINFVSEITILSLIRPTNTGAAPGKKLQEILILGVRINSPSIPADVIEHIAKMRSSGILFVCVRDAPAISISQEEEVAFAILRALPGRAGHIPVHKVFSTAWQTASSAKLELIGADMDEIWQSLNAQVIFANTDGSDLDKRITLREQLLDLKEQEEKLIKDHARVKTSEQRNELFAKLHKVRAQIEHLSNATS